MAKAIEGLEGVFKSVLVLGLIVTLAIAGIGAIVGNAIAGVNGILSALIASAVCFGFSSLTALSVWFGSKLTFAGFFGLVLGGWLLKLLMFFVIIAMIRQADFVNGPVFFFTLVAAILAGLALDSVVFLKARITIEPSN